MSSDRKKKDIELWKTWSMTQSQDDLNALVKHVTPIIQSQVNKLNTGNIPKSALEAKATSLVIDSLSGYDPKKTQLNTYLTWQLKPLNRYVYTHQNIGKIPESRITRIGDMQRAFNAFNDKFGREPKPEELADTLAMPVSEIKLLQKELRKDYSAGYGDLDLHTTNTAFDDAVWTLWGEVDGQERDVLEYIYGIHGKPKLSPSEIAVKLNISAARVSQIKAKLGNRLLRFKLENVDYYG